MLPVEQGPFVEAGNIDQWRRGIVSNGSWFGNAIKSFNQLIGSRNDGLRILSFR